MVINIERMKHVIDAINYHNELYFNYNTNEISDFEYDKLIEELNQLENKYGVVMSNSPLHTVGCEVKSELTSVKHNHPMLSLNKTKSKEDILSFLGDKIGLLMLKLDGLTISLRYNNGELVSAETRGNGEIGEDVLHNVKMFTNVPLTIPYKYEMIVDGEAIITYDVFDKINKNLLNDKKFSNPRNLASGSVRQLDSNIAKSRELKFIAWKLIKGNDNSNSFIDRLHWLETQGFDVVPFAIVNYNGIVFQQERIKDIEKAIDYLEDEAIINNLPIDGLVIGFDDINYGNNLGKTEHHYNSQLAYKFYDEPQGTFVTGIDWTIGKTGILTPVVIFEPVLFSGSIISKASAHNVSILKELDIHCGDKISVYKANDIIPQIKMNLSLQERKEQSEKIYINIPDTCPYCGFDTKIIKSNNTEILVCTNDNCEGKLLQKLSHFVSRDAMNIKGLNDATLQYLIDVEVVKNYSDLYTLQNKKTFIIEWKHEVGYGDKSVEKNLNAINDSKNTTLDRFLYALSIPLIGKSKAKTISKYFNGSFWNGFYKEAIINTFNFEQLEDFGYAANQSIQDYINNNKNLIIELAQYLAFETDSMKTNSNKLNGLVFVITGKLNNYTNRDELKSVIELNGGKVSNSVTNKTHYLINNDYNSVSGKNKKAIELNIPIITEKDFMEMLEAEEVII